MARRLVPTIVWLAVGLALFVAARSRGARAAVEVGGGLVAVALLKAIAYDTVHLGGLPRVACSARSARSCWPVGDGRAADRPPSDAGSEVAS